MLISEEVLRSVCDREALFGFLEVLGWDVTAEDTFTYDVPIPNSSSLPHVSVSHILPFGADDPYTLLLVEFATEFKRADLRNILKGVREYIRTTGAFSRVVADKTVLPKLEEIVFVCATAGYKGIRFAHFEQRDSKRQPRLRVFGWDCNQEKGMATLRRINIEALRLPRNSDKKPNWEQARWMAAWDVEAVTREFYTDYESVFHGFEGMIKGNYGDSRWFTQRLFNRLFFIRFLEMKRWLTFKDASGVDRTDYLRSLFEASASENFYDDRLFWVFFHGLGKTDDVLRTEEELQRKRGKVRFLNGGLFEMEPDGSDDERAVRIENSAFIPIFDLFDSYNFTVTESAPDDVEVAVDPEMLGKVFEELVTREDRQSTGSYYTPRTVVSFMCREVLKGYLGGYEAIVEQEEGVVVSTADARLLLQQLAAVKIIDPACGSGAYLLGMLRELFTLTRFLEVRAESPTPTDDYDRKLKIIETNLYGVDKTKFATQIARLRLWLSLIVEFDGDCPPPLPNLDFQIETGDSLTAPDPVYTPNLLRHGAIEEFQTLKATFTRTHDNESKRVSRRQIDTLREEIRQNTHGNTDIIGFDWAVEFSDVFKAGGFDIVLANPPYGASVEEGVRDLYFHRTTEGAQSKDTYGLFIARALQLIRPGGQFSFIISDTWRTIRTHHPLRRRLANQTTVAHVLDLPSWIFNATVNTCVLTLAKVAPPDNHRLIAGDLRGIKSGDWQTLENNLRAVAAHGPDVQTIRYARYTYQQSIISNYENASFFIGSPSLYSLMSSPNFTRLKAVADVRQGLATTDNAYYLRKRADVRGSYRVLEEDELLTTKQMAALTEDEKYNGVDPASYDGRHFVPYDKGGESNAEDGWMPNYYVPTGYFIDWSREAVYRLKTHVVDPKTLRGKAVIRNPKCYFKKGVTFSDTGFYAPTFRFGCEGVFDVMGMSIFSEKMDAEILLAVLSSRLVRYLIKNFINHTVHTQVEGLKPIPLIVEQNEITIQITSLVNEIVTKQKAEPRYAYHLHEQKQIDALIFRLYGLDEKDIREVDLWYCRRYERLAYAQGLFDDVLVRYADYLAWCAQVMSKPA